MYGVQTLLIRLKNESGYERGSEMEYGYVGGSRGYDTFWTLQSATDTEVFLKKSIKNMEILQNIDICKKVNHANLMCIHHWGTPIKNIK